MKKFAKKFLSVFLALMMVLPSMAVLEAISPSQTITAQAATKAKVTVAAPKSLSVKAKASNSLDVSFKKVSKANGYVIYYSTSKKFTKKTTKKVTVKVTKKLAKKKTITKRISKLKNNKKYYIRVRAYRTVNKKKVYSKYTKTKAVKAKKITKAAAATTQPATQQNAEPTTQAPAQQEQPATTQPVSTMPEKLPVNTGETTAPAGVTVVEGYIPENPATEDITYSSDDETTFTKEEWVNLLSEKMGITAAVDNSFGYSYSDIAESQYADVIEAAYQYGILPESADTDYDPDNDVPRFNPTAPATREFAAYTATRAAGFTDENQDILLTCSDAESVTYKTEVKVAIHLNMLSVDADNNFNPDSPMTGTDKNQIFAKLDKLNESENIDGSTVYQNIVYSNTAEGAASSSYTVTDNGNDTYTVTIPQSAGNFVVGDVVVLPANSEYTGGFPIKVTAVSASNGMYTIAAVTPEIQEVYSTLQFQGYATPDVNSITFADGVEGQYVEGTNSAENPSLNNGISSDKLKVDIGGDYTTSSSKKLDVKFSPELDDGTTLDVSLTCSIPEIKVRLDAKLGWSGIKINDLIISATERLEFDAEVTAASGAGSDDQSTASKLRNGTYPLGSIGFQICPGLYAKANLYARASIDGKIKINYIVEITNGFQYVDGVKKNIYSINNVNDELYLEVKAKLGAKVSLGLYALSVYDIISFAADGGLGVFASVSIHNNVNPTLCCVTAKGHIYLTLELESSCLVYKILNCFTSNLSMEIWNEDNSVWARSYHFENGRLVDSCTYGNGKLSGRVVNASNNGIPGASISIYYKGSSIKISSIYTMSDGTFETSSFPYGEYDIVISATGYARYKSTETISSAVVYLQPYKMTSRNGEATGIVDGTIKNAETGGTINNVTYTVYKDWNSDSSSEVVTSGTADGTYSVELNVGYYTIKFAAEGYSSNSVNVTVIEDTCVTANVVLNIYDEALEGLFRVVLTWGETPSDLDSHLYCKSESGDNYHVYYSNKNGYDSDGNRVANLDVDDTSSYGPETVTIYDIDESATYEYYVHNYSYRHYSDSSELSNSGAIIRIYNGNDLIGTRYIPANVGGTVWHVFDYNPVTNDITSVDEMYYQSNPEYVEVKNS